MHCTIKGFKSGFILLPVRPALFYISADKPGQTKSKSVICAEDLIAMEKKLIEKNTEYKVLTNYFTSKGSEFIAVYGSRRVGKTFLIRKAANDK